MDAEAEDDEFYYLKPTTSSSLSNTSMVEHMSSQLGHLPC